MVPFRCLGACPSGSGNGREWSSPCNEPCAVRGPRSSKPNAMQLRQAGRQAGKHPDLLEPRGVPEMWCASSDSNENL
jgi:hypothetical protein